MILKVFKSKYIGNNWPGKLILIISIALNYSAVNDLKEFKIKHTLKI